MPASASSPAARNGRTLKSERRGGPRRHGLHIDGVREPAASGEHFASINPATGAVWAEFADAGADDVDRAVAAAAMAFTAPQWGGLSPTCRGRLLMRFGDLVAEHAEELATVEGIPSGVINVVTGTARAGAALVEHPGVAKVAFTGGDAAGRVIARTVAGRLGRYTLELGGKSPNIVFADAQLEAAEAGVLAGIFAAGGQTCVAGSRLLVQREVHDQLVSRLVARAGAIRLGDPLDSETQMGPIATAAQLQRVDSIGEYLRAKSVWCELSEEVQDPFVLKL
ncbi:MAG TPA: aldehyde dehydrogenase family protein [Solirubrobacteraceae bacterium]